MYWVVEDASSLDYKLAINLRSFVVKAPQHLVKADPKRYKGITVLLNSRGFYINNSWVGCPGVAATCLYGVNVSAVSYIMNDSVHV